MQVFASSIPPAVSQDEPFFYRRWFGGPAGNLQEKLEHINPDKYFPDGYHSYEMKGPKISLKKGLYAVWFCTELSFVEGSAIFFVKSEKNKSAEKKVQGPHGLVNNNIDWNDRRLYVFSLHFSIAENEENVTIGILGQFNDYKTVIHDIFLNEVFSQRVYRDYVTLMNQIKYDEAFNYANRQLTERFIEQGRQRSALEASRQALQAEQEKSHQLTQQILALQARVAELESHAGGLSGQVQHWQSHAGNLESSLHQTKAEIDQQKEELTLQRKKITTSSDQIKKLLKSLAERDRKITNAVKAQRTRSTSIARRSDLVLSKLNIRSGKWIYGFELFVKQENQDISLGKIGGEGDSLSCLELTDVDPIIKIAFGANNEQGFLSGFSFTLNSGNVLTYGAFLAPYQEFELQRNEKLIGLFGYADQYIQTLGFITDQREYGPFGDNTDGENFSIVPVNGKL